MTEDNKETKTQVGRPAKYQTLEQLDAAILDYFRTCETRQVPILTKDGVTVMINKPAPEHITGLCLHLDLHRDTLLEYQKNPIFSDSVTRAKQRCESYAVNALYEGQKGNKADFVLTNNFGWKNKQDVNHGGQADNPLNIGIKVDWSGEKDSDENSKTSSET